MRPADKERDVSHGYHAELVRLRGAESMHGRINFALRAHYAATRRAGVDARAARRPW